VTALPVEAGFGFRRFCVWVSIGILSMVKPRALENIFRMLSQTPHRFGSRGCMGLLLLRIFGISVIGCLLFSQVILANPKGPQVTNGQITITQTPGVTTISQATAKGIIHWQDFSIGAGELTQFVHPNVSAATLNRVVGGIPTTIQGTLQANGQVYLVNPNGIVVGPSGRINTAAFVASTLDVSDQQFLAGGDMRFTGNSLQGVTNFGSITATNGDVVLLGHYVQNAGAINAPNGVAALAAGDDILLQPAGDERVVVNSGIPTGGTGVQNSGSIKAAQAELKAAGGNVYALAVNNTGVIKATGIATKNGRVILSANGGMVQNSGQISAQNLDGSGGSVRLDSGKGGTTVNNGSINAAATDPKKNGGTVELLGDTVNVGGSSVIDVGGANAGTVSVGVSAMIANQATATGGIANLTAAPATPTAATGVTGTTPQANAAQQTVIQANSRILANATSTTGNGGHIVVWSEQQTTVGGILEANAGTLGGNGGIVETSGRTGLTIFPGTVVHTSAPKGKAGTWLLDPDGITIDNTTTDTTAFGQNSTTNHVKASDIATALQSGNVNIVTSGSFSPNTDITVASAIVTDNTYPANTLALFSAGGININAGIGGTGTSVNLILSATNDINIATGAPINTAGAQIRSNKAIQISGAIGSTNNSDILLASTGGDISFVGTGSVNAGTGSVYIDTHNSSSSTISSSGLANAVVGHNLDIWSNYQGVGTSAAPLNTAVDNLVATVNNNNATGGGVFINNSSGGTLHIGGVTALPSQPAAGILVPSTSGYLGVELKNNAGNILIDSTTSERITAQGDIKLTTTGSGDIKILNSTTNSIRSHNGSVTLNAAGNVLIGDASSNIWGINVRGYTSVNVQAGGDVTVAGSLLKAGGGSGLSVTAGGNINVLTSNGFAAIIGTSGNVPIFLTTGAGKTFTDNATAGGGLTTKLSDDLTNTAATGASISVKADAVSLASPINAGTGDVTFTPVTSAIGYNIGTKSLTELTFTSAELGEITAAEGVFIGSLTGTGNMTVSHSISAPSGFNSLVLATAGGITVNQPITFSTGSLVLVAGTGLNIANDLTANDLTLNTAAGDISAGASKITANHLSFQADGGNAVFTNNANSIGAINSSGSDVSSAKNISLNNSGSIAVNGQLGTTGTTQSIYLHPGGDLAFGPVTSLQANSIELNISNGSLINQAGASVLSAPSYYVWQANVNTATHEGGIPGDRDTSDPVSFPSNPLSPDPRVFYYGIVAPPTPPTPPTTSGPPVGSVATITNGNKAAAAPNGFQLTGLARRLTEVADPLAFLRQQSLEDIQSLTTAILTYGEVWNLPQDLINDVIKVNQEKTAQQAQIADEQAAAAKNTGAHTLEQAAADYRQKQADAYAKVFDGNLPENIKDALSSGLAIPGSPLFLTPEEISQLTPGQVLHLAQVNGAKLTSDQNFDAATASFTPQNLATMTKSAGGTLTNGLLTTLLAAGAGNLTVAQLIAAGGGNTIAQGGGNLVSTNGGNTIAQGGGNFSIVDKNGKLINQDGASLSIDALAAMIAKGDSLIGHDGGSLIGHDGGSLIGHDGGSLIGHDGGSIFSASDALIGHDGGSFASVLDRVVADSAKLIGHDGGSMIGQDGAGIIGHNASALTGAAGSSLIPNPASGAAMGIQLQSGAGIRGPIGQ
jgi:filamentous hemagglutinin family protein